MKKYIFLFIFSLSTQFTFAAFDFNENCKNAYRHIISLRLTEGKKLIEAEKKSNPNNAIIVLLENYVDYFTIFTSENKADFDRLKGNKDARIKRIEQESKTSPYYRFIIAEINLQWAISRGRFGDYLTSAREIKNAYNLLAENDRIYPDFLPNYKSLGVMNAILGALPSNVKGLVRTFIGVSGDSNKGISLLEDAIKRLPGSAHEIWYDETAFYICFVQFDILTDANAYQKMLRYIQPVDDKSLLKTYTMAYVASRSGKGNEAIQLLQNRPKGTQYTAYPYLDYLLGVAKLNRGDADASTYFKTYLSSTKSTNYIKDAQLRIGWQFLLSGNVAAYRNQLNLVKSTGSADVDRDKQALAEANSGVLPDLFLLNARLAYDGGYYDKALRFLDNKNIDDFRTEKDKLEFTYRLGQIAEAQNKPNEAIQFYDQTIERGASTKFYFPANAALKAAGIFERAKDFTNAGIYYRKCLSMRGHEYKDIFDNRAKAGLERIGK